MQLSKGERKLDLLYSRITDLPISCIESSVLLEDVLHLTIRISLDIRHNKPNGSDLQNVNTTFIKLIMKLWPVKYSELELS